MIVYILYNFSDVVGVYTTREKAEEAEGIIVQQYLDSPHKEWQMSPDVDLYFQIQELELDVTTGNYW